jgi:hypothetical protein
MVERALVRALVAVTLVLALLAFVVVPVPLGEDGNLALPAAAFGQVALYRLEVALLVFYGGLLIATPAFSGLFRGRLPIEISARGAKFADGTDRSAKRNEAEIRRLNKSIRNFAEALADMNAEIDGVKQKIESDNTQPEVDSKR